MATPFGNPQSGLRSWDVFFSIRKGECRCVLISGRTLDEAWKTLALDPADGGDGSMREVAAACRTLWRRWRLRR
jgi:hypothetical protein